jgi:hypothetical protein
MEGLDKAFYSLMNYDRVPRKMKLKLIGRKLRSKVIKKKMNDFMSLNPSDRTMDRFFCPKCGGYVTYQRSYPVEYPEEYNELFCLGDHELIGCQDNSPWYSAIEQLFIP